MEENWTEKDVIGALRAEASKSAHCIVEPAAFMGGMGARARSIAYCEDGSTPTLKSALSGGNTVPDVVYALQGNGIDRSDTAGCNGKGWREDAMYTLNTIDRPAVVYPDTARTLAARHDSSPCVDRGQNVVAIDCRNMVGNEEVSATLQAKSNGGQSLNYQNPVVYRNGGYGDMVEGVGTLRANGGDAGGGPRVSSLSVFDARGNGDGAIAPTMTGDHENRVTDYTAVLVERHE